MVDGVSAATICFWASATAPFSASLLSFRPETSELNVVVVDFTSEVLAATAATLVLASVALASAAAAALLASPIWASRCASSSFSCWICCCCVSSLCRSASTCSARIAVADFAGTLAAFLGFEVCVCDGCGSSSFGVSANAVPQVRKSDNTTAAVFLISSLTDRRCGHPSVCYCNFSWEYWREYYPGSTLWWVSYGRVNRM